MVGAGIVPEDVNIRELAEMLSATSAALDALAQESGRAVVIPSLKTIKRGSAVTVLWSEEPTWAELARSFYDAVETRCVGFTQRVRDAFARLHRSVKVGSIAVAATGIPHAPSRPRIVMAAPVDEKRRSALYSTTYYGCVVGVNQLSNGRFTVKIAHMDGGREDFETSPKTAAAAARLFDHTVRAEVEMGWDGNKRSGLVLRTLSAWSEPDFVASLLDARRELAARGVTFDLDAVLKELD